MAWEAVSKDEVAALSGVASSALRDEWYNMAIAVIAELANLWNIGTPTNITEVKDGNGTSRIMVNRPPVYSVTSVKIDDVPVPASAIVYDSSGIHLKSTVSVNPYVGRIRFERGVKNVELAYVSGSPVVDHSVSLAIALIVKELSNLKTAEGTDSRLFTFRPTKSHATEDPLYEWGVHGKIKGIITSLLGTKFRVA